MNPSLVVWGMKGQSSSRQVAIESV